MLKTIIATGLIEANAEIERLQSELAALKSSAEPVARYDDTDGSITWAADFYIEPGAEIKLYTHSQPAPSAEPARFGKSKDIRQLTENILTDCGISTEYRPLFEKIEARLWDYFDASQPTSDSDKRDAERLDLLEKHDSKVFKLGDTWYWRPNYGQPHRKAASLRKAIDSLDAAMQKGGA